MHRFILAICVSASFARAAEISIEEPSPKRYVGPLIRPFHVERRNVGPVQLTDFEVGLRYVIRAAFPIRGVFDIPFCSVERLFSHLDGCLALS